MSADDLKIGLDNVEALKVKTSEFVAPAPPVAVTEPGGGGPPTKVEQ